MELTDEEEEYLKNLLQARKEDLMRTVPPRYHDTKARKLASDAWVKEEETLISLSNKFS